ncbi:right-handed parallel beta-helix repeat-containing protein [Candidatus Latescibacterota bacterium]
MKNMCLVIFTLLFSVMSVQGVEAIELDASGWHPTSVGTWDPTTKTGTLTQNVTEKIRINGSNLTLDGGNYEITVPGGYGVEVYYGSGNTVRNVTFSGCEWGIYADKSKNCLFENNTFIDCTQGIRAWVADNAVCKDNEFNNSLLYLLYTPSVTIENNTFYLKGISLVNSNNSTIKSNVLSFDLKGGGIGVSDSDSSLIEDNEIIFDSLDNNSYGIWIYKGSMNNCITGNTVKQAGYGLKMGLYGASNNEIVNNTFEINRYGVYIAGYSGYQLPENNSIYHNNFLYNTYYQAFQYRSGINQFYIELPEGGGSGNYWSNWTTPDADNDCIVDNPYIIFSMYSVEQGIDNYPWTTPWGWKNKPPAANAGDNLTVEATGVETEVQLDGSGSSDPDEDDLTYTWTYELDGTQTLSGVDPTVSLPLGDFIFSLVVNDGKLDSPLDQVSVSVVDTTPPDLDITLSSEYLWPPNHKMTDIIVTVEVSDTGTENTSVILESITSSEPDDGTGDGDTADDIQGAEFNTFDTEFQLRAERSGNYEDAGTGIAPKGATDKEGRTYTIVYSATDASGNSTSETLYVYVAHDQGKKAGKLAAQVPGSFMLYQNAPNPFNPLTTIEYAIPAGKSEYVILNVYDIRGALVRTLVDHIGSPGIHSVVWDGTDESGNNVSSGIYIYMLQAGEFRKSNKMILMR